jgi:tight adherence protein B
LAVGILAALSISGLAYALLSPLMDRQDKKERINKVPVVDRRAAHARQSTRRMLPAAARTSPPSSNSSSRSSTKRPRTAGSSKVPLELRVKRAGLNWNRRTFLMISATCALALYAAISSLGAPIYASLAGAIAGAFGLPNWYVNFKGKRRMKKFLLEFPNAVDVIVRGMKAGLPLADDCMQIVARRGARPGTHGVQAA